MWCATCQRDFSASADSQSADPQRAEPVRCAKCGATLGYAESAEHDHRTDTQHTSAGRLDAQRPPKPAPALPADDWQLEADVRGVHRLVEKLRSTSRLDQPAAISGPHQPPSAPEPARSSSSERATSPTSNFVAWTLLSAGLATFACGAVLLGWSFATGRQDLWPLGMPLALGGQAALLLGLVLQLDGLWQTSRKNEKTLSALDDELSRVRQTTLLSTPHSGPGQTFYAHLAEGASPQLLLADVKGQLDLLAQRIAK